MSISDLNMKMYLLLYLALFVLQLVNCKEDHDQTSDLPPNIVRLTTKNFDELVTQDDSIWLVEFIIPVCGPCQKVVEEFYNAAKALKGVAKIGIINAREDNEIATRLGVDSFPSFRIISGNEAKPFDGKTNAKSLVNAVLDHIHEHVRRMLGGTKKGKTGEVMELTDKDFTDDVLESPEPWLVMFYAPWCGHCQNFKPHFRKAAKNMVDKVRFGSLDATIYKALADKYKVTGYPTVKYFPAGKKSAKSAVDYSAGRMADNVVEWLNNRLAEDIPPPDVTQITSSDIFEGHCVQKQLCIILFVPDLLDCSVACREKYLRILKEIGDESKAKNWGWLWSEASTQGDLERSMDLGGFGYPALAVLNSKKMRCSIFRGSFSKKSIQEFLKEIGTYKASSAPLRGASLPKIADAAPWDGSEGPDVVYGAREETTIKQEL